MASGPVVKEALVAVRETQLLVRRSGAGEAVLFLHGTQGVGAWLPCFASLAAHYDLLVPDHPGFGRSTDPRLIDDCADLAYFYLDALDALGPQRVHVIGHEIGGQTAIEMALRSSRIASLTLVGSAGLHVDGVPKGDFFISRPDELPALFFVDAEAGRAYLESLSVGQDPAIPHRNRVMAARLAWHPRLINPKLGRWLHRVSVPTRLIWGDTDRVIPPQTAQGFLRAMPQAKLVTIANAGHFPHVERSGAFSDVVLEFLRSLN